MVEIGGLCLISRVVLLVFRDFQDTDRQGEKGTTEDEMAGWHHWLDGRESQWTPGVGDGQGGLACCDSWVRKELDTTEWLIWSDFWFLEIFKTKTVVSVSPKGLFLISSWEGLGNCWGSRWLFFFPFKKGHLQWIFGFSLISVLSY